MSDEQDETKKPVKSRKLSHDLFHGLSPEEFDSEAQSLADAEAMTPQVRARLKAQLIERLMTPPDKPSWGPDWVKRGDRDAPRKKQENFLDRFRKSGRSADDARDDSESVAGDLTKEQRDDADIMVRNLEKSRQIHHYRTLYVLAALIAISIAVVAMFVDYQIIRGDVWTRALSNEFMVVPASLQSSVVFKSLQVIFAVLIVHFMLKITGVYGRNAMVTTAFVCAIVMVCGLGYLVAYNNMAGGTSATLEHKGDSGEASPGSSVDQLFASTDGSAKATEQPVSDTTAAPDEHAAQAGVAPEEASFHVPKISQQSLDNADPWVWMAFASVIFLIVTVVAALYLQTTENNVRNVIISRDYKHRQRQFAQLHLLELADHRQNGQAA
ncbi:MAG: hypothetical protein ABSD74_12605 [Rhizomicrobium sp.]|jgi:hypothetical protein